MPVAEGLPEALGARVFTLQHRGGVCVAACSSSPLKPHLVPTVLGQISPHVTRQHVVVSVQQASPCDPGGCCCRIGVGVVRLMPNLPCVLQEGALAIGPWQRGGSGGGVTASEAACSLRADWWRRGPEGWIDAHKGHERQRRGVRAGLMLRDCGKPASVLRAEVCTPGGTTIHGLHALEKGGVRAAVMSAVEAATERARELGRK
ncbi:pyrroline-5-carboxylate reductase 3-like [Denticeps clupeoides]|uniref:pyrroline-5-carboxylate reductase 3-like n=1 Tax=Denticeps clupeoides TaxID=299321 RepID=UPI0010A3D84D|nr:pyrroline-5-carboxylate reductase 3-like [Denticeps clupeoides]